MSDVREVAEAKVRDLVTEHRDRTGSTVAGRLLDDWDTTLRTLVKVMPNDYKKVLEQRKRDRAAAVEAAPA